MTSLRRDSQRGFTLLEVLVAFTILAISLGAAYAVFGAAARASERAAGALEALTAVESAIDRIGVDVSAAPGQYILQQDEWRVSLQIEDVGDAAEWSAIGVRALDVAAAAERNDGGPGSARLRVLRLAATP